MDSPSNKTPTNSIPGADSLSDAKRRLMEKMLQGKQGNKVTSAASGIPKRSQQEPAQLSFAQQRLWFLDQLNPGNTAYVFSNLVRLSGSLNVEALKASFANIVARHENLRTRFIDESGIPRQEIFPHLEFEFPLIDLSGSGIEAAQKQLTELAHQETQQAIDLKGSQLFRVKLCRLTDDQHAVIITMHHIIYDGWSLAVLFSDWKQFYEAHLDSGLNKPANLAVQYADFAVWQRGQLSLPKMQQQLAFWKEALSGDLPVLNLPSDRPRPPVASFRGETCWMHLPLSLSQQLESLARREDCTLFMVLYAAFVVLLSRYSGETDILVGSPIAGRNHRDVENLIGFFINTVVMRTSLSNNPDFCELLQQVKQQTGDAYANQDIPFEKLVEELQPERTLTQNPFFQVMFALQNTPAPPESMADLAMSVEEVDGSSAVFDLTMSLYQSKKGLNGYFEYSTDLFDKSTIERMLNHYQNLLQNIVDRPEQPISKLGLLSAEEINTTLVEWNQRASTANDISCIHHLFEQWADKAPDSLALVTQDQRISYKELNSRANQLAHCLLAHGVERGDIVGICLTPSVEVFASILAILKIGAAYLPLDPSYPSQRLQLMINDSGARIVISDSQYSSLLNVDKKAVLLLDQAADSIAAFPITKPASNVTKDDLAYIIYTSGSTGNPKGVMISHANIVHSTSARIKFYQQPVKRFLLMSSFAFDSSVAGIFWTLSQGGELHLPPTGSEKELLDVADVIAARKITHMLCLPSVYGILLEHDHSKALASLEYIIVAGESCPNHLVAKHFELAPARLLFNEYGPTEGTVWTTVQQLGPEHGSGPVPIGKPIDNVQVYILDQALQPTPIGVIGEVCIGGDGVAKGYLGRDQLTAEKFIANPFAEGKLYRSGDSAYFLPDGSIVFAGRKDDQVKLRGFRIELGEIESAIRKHEGVNDVVVAIVERNFQHQSSHEQEQLVRIAAEKLAQLSQADCERLLVEVENIK